MREVRHSDVPVIIEDAVRDPKFAQDPYFGRLACCSLMIVPVVSYGQSRAVLMLENTLRPGAFVAVSQDVVMLIARQLAISLENVGVYRDLEQLVEQRTVELRAAQEELLASAHRAGMAEVATNVLHNVGNVLNSVNVSVSLIRGQIRESKVSGLSKAVKMLDENSANLASFLANDRRGQLIREYLGELARAHAQEQWTLLNDMASLARNVEHIKEIVSMQQSFARRGAAFVEMIQVDELIGDAVRVNAEALEDCGATFTQQIEGDMPALSMDRHRMMQVLVNLIRNACQAIDMSSAQTPEVKVTAGMVGGGRLRIVVSDTGRGIEPQDLHRIFSHGFTTRGGGHGFGLHSCALAAMEMGGELAATSDGPGRGASFSLEVPVAKGQ
jgi:signal transduction histidine kinase